MRRYKNSYQAKRDKKMLEKDFREQLEKDLREQWLRYVEEQNNMKEGK